MASEGSEAWPRQGSTVEYELRTSFTAPDGSYHREATATLALAYDGTLWSGSCVGSETEVVDGVATSEEFATPSLGTPPVGPTDAKPGETVALALLDDPQVAEACRQRGETVEVVRLRGGSILAEEMPETSDYQDVAATWDRETGLVLEWTRAVRTGSVTGRLVHSDALPS